MLSRVADSLYWMSRYLERAEHTARLLGVQENLMLEQDPRTSEARWRRVLESLNQPRIPDQPRDFYGFARSHLLVSIVTSLMSARENARQVLEHISSEIWEQINRLFHRVRQAEASGSRETDSWEFLSTVIEGAHLFQGLSDSTMAHGEGWHFIQLGRFLERAHNTAALVDVHFRDFESAPETTLDAREYLEWAGLLRCCCAFEAYCKTFRADLTRRNVAEFLLLNPEFPHSIRFAADQMELSLHAIHQLAGSPPARRVDKLAGRLKATLSFTPLEELMSDFGSALQDMGEQCRRIHSAVYQMYVGYPIEIALEV